MSALSELARYTFSMFRPPAAQTVSEWADENRVLVSESSAEPGAWRTDRAPYQREIMDAFTQPGIWQIVIMASAQVGKSEIELNMMGCAIDNDPGPMLYIQPTDKVAEDYSKRRIAPMINACPTLREKVFKARSRDARAERDVDQRVGHAGFETMQDRKRQFGNAERDCVESVQSRILEINGSDRNDN